MHSPQADGFASPTLAAATHESVCSGAEGAAMNALTKSLHMFLNQDVARQNAAAAAHQVVRERQQRVEVEAYLAQVNGSPHSTEPVGRRSTADLRGRTGRV